VKVKLVVQDTGGDLSRRYVGILSCRGVYFGHLPLTPQLWGCEVAKELVEPKVGSYVEFDIEPMDTFYIVVSSDTYWLIAVYVEGQYITSVLCNKDNPVEVYVGDLARKKKYYVLELVFLKVPSLYDEEKIKSVIESKVVPIIESLGYTYEQKISVRDEGSIARFFVLFSGYSPAIPWHLIVTAIAGAIGGILLYLRWYELHVKEKELEVKEEYVRTQEEVINEAKKLHDEGVIDDKTYQEIISKVSDALAKAGRSLSKEEQEDTAKKLMRYITEWLPTLILALIILEAIRTFRR